MYANMLNRLKNYFGIENIFVDSSIHKMELFKVIHKKRIIYMISVKSIFFIFKNHIDEKLILEGKITSSTEAIREMKQNFSHSNF